MNYLGIDLGTKKCGLSYANNLKIVTPLKLIKYSFEDYDYLEKEIRTILEAKKITDIVIGLPKNMDGTEGFASQRSILFANRFNDYKVHLIDERLTTQESTNIIHGVSKNMKNSKDIIDNISACLILETYLSGEGK